MPADLPTLPSASRAQRKDAKAGLLGELKSSVALVSATVAFMWILEGIDFLVGGRLDVFGIHPRSAEGLYGILFAPFLHGGFGHLASNTIPFIVLSLLILMRRMRDWFVVSGLAAFLGGFLVWLTGASNSVHIGASSLIFGYLGYLLSRGIFERKLPSILLSLGVLFGYGGVIYGVLPGQPGISWQGHLFGFLSGILGAWLLSGRKAKTAPVAKRAAPPAARTEPQALPPSTARVAVEPAPTTTAEEEAELEEELARLRARARSGVR